MLRPATVLGLATLALTAAACAPSRTVVTPTPVVTPAPAAGKQIVREGGNYVLPDGTRVAINERGGFSLPNGEVVIRERSGALILPNGARCVPSGAGFTCP